MQTVTARVVLTVEVSNLGCWDLKTTMDQVHKQAIDSAICRVNTLNRQHGHENDVRMVGVPKVIMVSVYA